MPNTLLRTILREVVADEKIASVDRGDSATKQHGGSPTAGQPNHKTVSAPNAQMAAVRVAATGSDVYGDE